MELTKNEILLKYLLEAKKEEPNVVSFYLNDYDKVGGIEKSEFLEVLDNLEKDYLVQANFLGRRSTQSICHITLLSGGLHYFENKKEREKQTRRETGSVVLEWLSFGLSIVAIIISIIALFVD